MFSILLPLIAQVGIAPTASPISAVPPELRDRPPREGVAAPTSPTSTALDTCLATARSDPAKARALAEEWVSRTTGPQRAAGRHCLGVAASNGGDWGAAASAFLAARDDAAVDDAGEREVMRLRAELGDELVTLDAALDAKALLVRGATAEALVVRGVAVLERFGHASP